MAVDNVHDAINFIKNAKYRNLANDLRMHGC